MSEQRIEVLIEIPFEVDKREVWDFEERLKQVGGIKTDLLEPKDFIATTMLVLHVTTSVMGPIAAIGAGIKSIHDVAKILYDFLHSSNKEKVSETSKKKVVIIKNGKRIELYGLSIEEIERILKKG